MIAIRKNNDDAVRNSVGNISGGRLHDAIMATDCNNNSYIDKNGYVYNYI